MEMAAHKGSFGSGRAAFVRKIWARFCSKDLGALFCSKDLDALFCSKYQGARFFVRNIRVRAFCSKDFGALFSFSLAAFLKKSCFSAVAFPFEQKSSSPFRTANQRWAGHNFIGLIHFSFIGLIHPFVNTLVFTF
jgi:hypothetical protein